MLDMLLLAALAMPANVLTVDDDGPAQFSSIQAAIDAASEGDVIEVASGTYGFFKLTKSLALVGPVGGPVPKVLNTSRIVGGAEAVIAGLGFQQLLVDGAQSVVLDRCSFGAASPPSVGVAALQIVDTDQALVSHGQIEGRDNAPGLAANVISSRVDFVHCTVTGGDGVDVFNGKGGDGGDALQVSSGSLVVLAATAVLGGDAGFGNIFLNPFNGKGGDGLVAKDSQVVARGGGPDAEFLLGDQDDPSATPAYSIRLKIGSVLTLTDAYYNPASALVEAGAHFLHPAQSEPVLDLQDTDGSGQHLTLSVYGPAGAVGLLLVSLQLGAVDLPKLEWPLWPALGGAGPVAVVTSGPQSPLLAHGAMPSDPGLEGHPLLVQGIFSTLQSTLVTGTVVVTNPAVFVGGF